MGGSIGCLERNVLETKDSIRTLIKSDIHMCSTPDTLMINGAHQNTRQTLMKTIGRDPDREDGWMDMDVSKISDLQVPIDFKFNLEWKNIECPESNEWRV